jgi:serine/alanine adding enzyme
MATSRVLQTSNESEWRGYLGLVAQKQLVHFPRYARVYERYGDGTAECFVYEGDEGLVVYPYLRREIGAAPGYTDVITPYGYGGPVYSCRGDGSRSQLATAFRSVFASYARETRTVSEFVRFHPFLANHAPFVGLLDGVSLHCVNALVDLTVGADALFQQYRTSYQQCIRKAVASGLRVVPLTGSDFIDPFFDLYSASMLRKHQEGYVKFRREFLVDLVEEVGDEIKCFAVIHEEKAIAVALFQHFDDYLDYFLAASDPLALPLHPNHVLLYEVSRWAIGHQVKWLHLGGGHKTLQFFKHGFANRSCDYFIGKHVFDNESYERLSREHWARYGQAWNMHEPYFPGYRAELVAA